MKIKLADYNEVTAIVANEWSAIEESIIALSLHVKASDQAGLQGNPIFDPVGTNRAMKAYLEPLGWNPSVSIPNDYRFLGKDVDFEKEGIVLEVQFSNYPFLLNNVVRTYLFSRQDVRFNGNVPKALIVITKCKVFPSSNSTLYYEQSKKQLDVFASPDVFNLPIRLVGLSEDIGTRVPCIYTTYDNPRYSRTVVREENRTCELLSSGARATLRIE